MNVLNDRVISGAEAFFLQGKEETGILLCHGFVGTPQSVRDVGDLLNGYGFSVLAPRLSGHGTSVHDLERAKYTDWISDLEDAYFELKKSCKHVVAVGQSMGGALSLRLAAKYPEIKGVVAINPALHVPFYDSFRGGVGPRFIEEGAPDIKDPNATEITYDKVPKAAALELQKLLDGTPRLLSKVQAPTLVMTSPEDHVVPPADSLEILVRISSKNKKQILLTNSYHVASLDYDKQRIADNCNQFVKGLSI